MPGGTCCLTATNKGVRAEKFQSCVGRNSRFLAREKNRTECTGSAHRHGGGGEGLLWRGTFNYEGVADVWWRVVAAAVMDQDTGVAARSLKYSAQVMDSLFLACLTADSQTLGRQSRARSLACLRGLEGVVVVAVASEGLGPVMNMSHAYPESCSASIQRERPSVCLSVFTCASSGLA